MKLRTALLAATVLALPVAATAQPITGLYIGAGAGANMLEGQSSATKVGARVGFDAEGSVGWGFGNGFRIEAEGDFSQNTLRSGTFAGAGHFADGQERKNMAFVNALYDFTMLSPYVIPYVGAGVGYIWNDWTNVSFAGAAPGSSTYRYNQTLTNFGYQGIAGVAIPTPYPGLALTVEYRFLGEMGNRNYSGSVYTGATHGPANLKLSSDYNHAVLGGFRYAFNTPTPMPPPMAPMPVAAPAPAPARTYLVFFDWDRADLTARARQIIAEAAQSSTHVQYTRIQVNGYTDLSGSPAYNQGLSVRRAQSVAAELVRDGVPRTAINIQGFGESHPLVPTAQGVREPQNRRVEIIIQ